MKGQKAVGVAIGFTLLLSAFALGYYGLQYIPEQRAYFLTLRFRVLSAMGSQIRKKVESLESSLRYLKKVNQDKLYSDALLPDLQLDKEAKPGAWRMRFMASGDGMRLYLRQEEQIGYIQMERALGPLTREDLFDDILIADEEGNVVFQRSERGARVTHLTQLTQSKELYREMREEVEHGGLKYHVFMQRIRIGRSGSPEGEGKSTEEGVTLLLCGLTKTDELKAQARHVKPQLFLAVFLPLLAAGLAGPLLKLVLLQETGRMRLGDVLRLAGSTVLACGLGTLLLVGYAAATGERARMEKALEKEAGLIEGDLSRKLGAMTRFVRAVDRKAAEWDQTGCLTGYGDHCVHRTQAGEVSYVPAAVINLWNPEKVKHLPEETEPLDFLFWTSRAGAQLEKWTTKVLPTSSVSLKGSPYFVSLGEKRLMRVRGKESEPFTLQGLISTTTAQPIWVLMMESERRGLVEQKEIYSVSAVWDMKELTRRLLPPDTGFALLDADGSVLLHSQETLSMQENLLEETGEAKVLREAKKQRVPQSIRTHYRGREYLLHSRPVTAVEGAQWTVVTFRNLERRVASNWLATASAGVMLVLYLCLAGTLAVVTMLVLIRPWRYRPRRRILEATRMFWPCRRRAEQYWRITLMGVAMAAVWVAAMAGGDNGVVLCVSLLLPASGVVAAGWMVHQIPRKKGAVVGRREAGLWYSASLLTMCLLGGVVPAAGLMRVNYEHETWRGAKRWMQELGRGLESNWVREAAEVKGSPAYNEEAKKYIEEKWLAPGRCGKVMQSSADYNVFLAETRVRCVEGAEVEQSEEGVSWQAVMDSFVGEKLAAMAGLGPGETTRAGGQRWARCCGRMGLSYQMAAWEPSGSGGVPVRLDIEARAEALGLPGAIWFWAAVVCGLGALGLWIHKTTQIIFLMKLESAPLPEAGRVIQEAAAGGAVLVIGLPLSGKDSIVEEAWRRRMGIMDTEAAPPRLTLAEERVHEGWVGEKMAWVNEELSGRTRAAAAGGGVVSMGRRGREAWLHISNLECMLGGAGERKAMLELLEQLTAKRRRGEEIGLLVTSSLDPGVHFRMVLEEEMKAVYRDSMPEGELQRWSRVLHGFRKARVVEPELRKEEEAPEWRQQLWEECRLHRPMHAIYRRLSAEMSEWHPPPGIDVVMARTAEEAQLFYQLIWASLTRPYKLVLIQLAQSGYVNPQGQEALEDLRRKGLVMMDPQPRIMNETFTAFLERAESEKAVRAWEQEGGKSVWPVLRNMLAVVAVLGLFVVAATQRQAFQNLGGLITAVVGVVGGGFKLVEMIRNKKGPVQEG
ncbi:MAG: hypothetical protein FJW20_13185 [Acidimicrobiia bacterium]|nr:hypothetical protein [Acidimicrobiia bacterium]